MLVQEIEKVYKVKEAAKASGIGENTLRHAIAMGYIEHFTIGTHYRITARSINDFIKKLESGVISLRSL